MATTEASLLAEKADIETKLAELTTNPKPSYKVGDLTFQWNEYYKVLMARIQQIGGELDRLPGVTISEWDDPDR